MSVLVEISEEQIRKVLEEDLQTLINQTRISKEPKEYELVDLSENIVYYNAFIKVLEYYGSGNIPKFKLGIKDE